MFIYIYIYIYIYMRVYLCFCVRTCINIVFLSSWGAFFDEVKLAYLCISWVLVCMIVYGCWFILASLCRKKHVCFYCCLFLWSVVCSFQSCRCLDAHTHTHTRTHTHTHTHTHTLTYTSAPTHRHTKHAFLQLSYLAILIIHKRQPKSAESVYFYLYSVTISYYIKPIIFSFSFQINYKLDKTSFLMFQTDWKHKDVRQ